jgi:aryl-alcohol dehydrogenase-like predicted oxidoreductase
MKSLAISDKYGWEKFATIESMYSLANRSLEFEVIPVCVDQGVALLPWSPLHGGYLAGKYRRNKPLPRGTRFKSMDDPFWEMDVKMFYDIIDELDKVAAAHNATVSQAALNWALRKPAVCSLIVGMRRIEQFAENIKTTEWQLTDEELARLDKVSQPKQGYPYRPYIPQIGPNVP